jgi:hypothetical protein
MGDRGNIVIERNGTPVLFLYTHWSGSDLPNVVAAALEKGRSRWGDDPYLNRVLFQEMLSGDNGVTGFGIDTRMGDGGTEVYIDHDKQSVRYKDDTHTFDDFIGFIGFKNATGKEIK